MAIESLTDTLRETLTLFDEVGTPRTTTEVAEELDLGRRSTYDRLDRLVEHDRLRTKKVGASARVWWRTPTRPGVERTQEHIQLEALVDAVEEYAIFTLDTEGRVESWNPGARRIKGYATEEIVGSHFETFYTESDREAGVPEANLEAARREGETRDEGWRVRADGSRFWANVTITTIRDDAGELVGYAKVTRDDTDRRERERAIRRERNLFEHLLHVSPVAIGVFDTEGEVTRLNRRFVELLGREETDDATEGYSLGDEPLYDADGELIPYPERPAPRALATGESLLDERIRIDGDDRTRWLSVNAEPFDDEESAGVVVTMADVTTLEEQTRQLERQRSDLESELDEVFERIDDGFFALDSDLRFTYLNEHAREVLPVGEGSPIGAYIWDVLEQGDRAAAAFHEALETQEPVSFEEFYGPLGTWFENQVYPSESGISVYFKDVTERKRLEQELQTEQEHFRIALENSPVVAFRQDTDLRYTWVSNPQQEFDPGSAIGKTDEELLGPEAAETLTAPKRRALETGESVREEVSYELPGGKEVTYDLSVEPLYGVGEDLVGVTCAAVDVTERRERERELERYRAIVETVEDGIYAVDDDDRFVLVNGGFCQLTGYSCEELIGAPADTIHDASVTTQVRSMVTEMEHGERETATVDVEVHRADGESVACESRVTPLDLADGHGRCGVVRDVTEQRARERELKEYEKILETIDDGVYVLDEDGRFVTVNEAYEELTGYTEAELIGQPASMLATDEATMDRVEELHATQIAGEGETGRLETDIRTQSGGTIPIEVRFAPYLLGDAYGRVGVVRDMSERIQRERELARRHEQLRALDNLNQTIRGIAEEVIEQTTRESIEETVCRQLADTDSYLFAWIGDVDVETRTVNLRCEAGVEGYLDDMTISVDPDDPQSGGPTGQAILTREIQTSQDIHQEDRYDPWRGRVESYGFRSSAAVPIVHEGSLYGVLNIYAERPRAFEGEEREVVRQLGELVGHAIAAAERKRALMSDEMLELEYRIGDLFEQLDLDAEPTGTVRIDHAIPLEDEEFLVYGSATEDAVDTVEALVETIEHWTDVTFRPEQAGRREFEVHLTGPPVLERVASLGGVVREAVIEDGDYRMRIHLPTDTDVRAFTRGVVEAYPTAELMRRKQVLRTPAEGGHAGGELAASLTERQRIVLETAYYAGYFEWPRASTGENVAGSLGISSSTFSQHLRKAERKVFESLFTGVHAE